MKLSKREKLLLEKKIANVFYKEAVKHFSVKIPKVKLFLTPRDSYGNLKLSARVY